MNKIKFRLFISVIVLFVAVTVPLRIESRIISRVNPIYVPADFIDPLWDENRSDYESSGLEASKPIIWITPPNGLKMVGGRIVDSVGNIVTEEWAPHKPEDYHYITIALNATGYGEVAFELKGNTRDYAIGHWTSEPIKKAEKKVFSMRIKELNNVINKSIHPNLVGHIRDTKVDVSATGKALTRSRRVTTYKSRQEAKTVQASLPAGAGTAVVIGTSQFWKWEAGITRDVKADPYNGSYSIEINDSILDVTLNKWFFSTYDTLEVTVAKSDLYYASMSINGESADGKYASGNTSVTLKKSFGHDDFGYHEVAINIYYGENGEQSITHFKYVFILDD